MRTSEKGLQLIKSFEGIHDGDLSKIGLQPKKCPAGIWTQGYGTAMRDSNGIFLKGPKMPEATIHTVADAETQLKDTIKVYEDIVTRKLKKPVTQEQFDALVSHTYNTGGSDTLFKLVNNKASLEQIKKWFVTKYITANGKFLQGLKNRREAEFLLFSS